MMSRLSLFENMVFSCFYKKTFVTYTLSHMTPNVKTQFKKLDLDCQHLSLSSCTYAVGTAVN